MQRHLLRPDREFFRPRLSLVEKRHGVCECLSGPWLSVDAASRGADQKRAAMDGLVDYRQRDETAAQESARPDPPPPRLGDSENARHLPQSDQKGDERT